MNIEKLEQVEQWLLSGAPERSFNMENLLDDLEYKENWCGTTCCIAGYVYSQEVEFDPEKHNGRFTGYEEVEPVACSALGLSAKVARKLFYTENSAGLTYQGDWEAITPEQAAKAVRNVIDFGEPLWETALDFEEVDY